MASLIQHYYTSSVTAAAEFSARVQKFTPAVAQRRRSKRAALPAGTQLIRWTLVGTARRPVCGTTAQGDGLRCPTRPD